MRVLNEAKTQELHDFDLTAGKLIEDKVLLKHHDAVAAVAGKTAEQQAQELEATGRQVVRKNGEVFSVEKVYENGGRVLNEIKDIEPVEAKKAWDEYEDVYVFVPFTAEELKQNQINNIRNRRSFECFRVVDRGKLWYDSLTAAQLEELKAWYQAWLDAPQTGVAPDTLGWLK